MFPNAPPSWQGRSRQGTGHRLGDGPAVEVKTESEEDTQVDDRRSRTASRVGVFPGQLTTKPPPIVLDDSPEPDRASSSQMREPDTPFFDTLVPKSEIDAGEVAEFVMKVSGAQHRINNMLEVAASWLTLLPTHEWVGELRMAVNVFINKLSDNNGELEDMTSIEGYILPKFYNTTMIFINEVVDGGLARYNVLHKRVLFILGSEADTEEEDVGMLDIEKDLNEIEPHAKRRRRVTGKRSDV